MTCHQSEKQNENQSLEKLKLAPKDINIQKKFIKPNTSGASFRRPVSRNHPMLDKIRKEQSMIDNINGEARSKTIKKIKKFQ